MKYLILILIFLCSLSCGHNSGTKSVTAKHESVKVEKFSFSECLENCNLKSRLINNNLVNNIYQLSFGVHLNCAGDFITKCDFEQDTLRIQIDLKPSADGMIHEASCNCFFQFDYSISGIKNVPREILINGLTFRQNYVQNNETIEESKEN